MSLSRNVTNKIQKLNSLIIQVNTVLKINLLTLTFSEL